MKVVKNTYKCGVCGKENEYTDILSNFISGYNDFDMKPVGSMMEIGDNIKECPDCHYASYNITDPIEKRFSNNLELWNNSTEFQEIIKKYDGNLRKVFLVANQYKNNMDYENLCKSYIMLSWICDEGEAKEFRIKACEIFIKKMLPKFRDNFLQIADLLRMIDEFEDSNIILDSMKLITHSSEESILKIIDAEKKYISENDSSRHNLGEIFKDGIDK